MKLEGSGDATWVHISLLEMLQVLTAVYGSLGELARTFDDEFVRPAADCGVMVAPSSGSNYRSNPVFDDRSVLALQLYFDGVSTASNALGRAAIVTRKFYVISVRICNVPTMMKNSACIFPIAVVPPSAWDHVGFDGIARALQAEFDQLYIGMHVSACLFGLALLSMQSIDGGSPLIFALSILFTHLPSSSRLC